MEHVLGGWLSQRMLELFSVCEIVAVAEGVLLSHVGAVVVGHVAPRGPLIVELCRVAGGIGAVCGV